MNIIHSLSFRILLFLIIATPLFVSANTEKNHSENGNEKANIQAPLWTNAFKDLFGKTDPSGKIKTANNELTSVWFEQDFYEGKSKLHVVFIQTQLTNQGPEGEYVINCIGCAPSISAVTYKQINNKWQILSKQQKITEIGIYGDAPEIDQAEIIQLTSDKIAFLTPINSSLWGETQIVVNLLVFSKNQWTYAAMGFNIL